MPISVYFEEHEDSPRESGNRNGSFNFTRVFLTAYADRWTFVREIFTGGFLGLPMQYSADWPGVFAETFEIERLANNPINQPMTDPATQAVSHNAVAKITVNYSPLSLDRAESQLPDGTFAEYDMQASGEFVEIPSRGLKWLSDDQPLPADRHPVFPATTTRHVINWHRVINPPWVTMAKMMNKINSVAWKVPATKQTFMPQTLLFAARSASLSLAFNAAPAWKITLVFIEKAQQGWISTGRGPLVSDTETGDVYGWNHQWREDTGTFDSPVNATDDAPQFKLADLRQMFTATI